MKSKHAAKDLQSFKRYQTLSIVYIKLSTIGGDTLNNSLYSTSNYIYPIPILFLCLFLRRRNRRNRRNRKQEIQEKLYTCEEEKKYNLRQKRRGSLAEANHLIYLFSYHSHTEEEKKEEIFCVINC